MISILVAMHEKFWLASDDIYCTGCNILIITNL